MKRPFLSLLVIPSVIGIAYAADLSVTQSHLTFDVDSISVNTGDTIVFKNNDDVTHNIQVTNSDGDSDDKGLQKPGQDIKETFAQKGIYKVHCAIHPKMKMTVIVK